MCVCVCMNTVNSDACDEKSYFSPISSFALFLAFPPYLPQVVKQASNGWWEGELQSRGKKRAVGWFPANRVELLPQRQTSTSSSSSITSINIPLGGWAESILARSKSVSGSRIYLLHVTRIS